MARFQFIDEIFAMSKLPESAVNTPYSTATDFAAFLANAQMVPIPVLDKVDDSDMVGDGNEWPTDLRPTWWRPLSYSFGGKLNTEGAGRLWLRALGGTVTDSTISAGAVFDHSGVQQARSEGRQPKLSTFIMSLGGADFLWPSCAITSFETSFDADNPVQFTCGLTNTGYWKRLSVSYPTLVVPTPPMHHYMYPSQTLVTFSDGSTVNYASEGRLLSGRIGLTQNVDVKRLPGDPLITAGDPRSGAYSRTINRGKREPVANLRVSLDATLAEFTRAQNNTPITSLVFKYTGDKFASVAFNYEFEMKAPKCKLNVVEPDQDGDEGALSLNFWFEKDAASPGAMTGRIRDGNATLD